MRDVQHRKLTIQHVITHTTPNTQQITKKQSRFYFSIYVHHPPNTTVSFEETCGTYEIKYSTYMERKKKQKEMTLH
jgi:hypothetical protein